MNLKNFVCNIGEDAELFMSLYDPDKSEFIRCVCLFLLFCSLKAEGHYCIECPLRIGGLLFDTDVRF